MMTTAVGGGMVFVAFPDGSEVAAVCDDRGTIDLDCLHPHAVGLHDAGGVVGGQPTSSGGSASSSNMLPASPRTTSGGGGGQQHVGTAPSAHGAAPSSSASLPPRPPMRIGRDALRPSRSDPWAPLRPGHRYQLLFPAQLSSSSSTPCPSSSLLSPSPAPHPHHHNHPHGVPVLRACSSSRGLAQTSTDSNAHPTTGIASSSLSFIATSSSPSHSAADNVMGCGNPPSVASHTCAVEAELREMKSLLRSLQMAISSGAVKQLAEQASLSTASSLSSSPSPSPSSSSSSPATLPFSANASISSPAVTTRHLSMPSSLANGSSPLPMQPSASSSSSSVPTTPATAIYTPSTTSPSASPSLSSRSGAAISGPDQGATSGEMKRSKRKDTSGKQRAKTIEDSSQQMEDGEASGEIVRVNVGGKEFITLRSTLCRFQGTFLEAIFSGRHRPIRDSSGRLFIDRNPQHFQVILDFLRDPTMTCPELPSQPEERQAFLREVDYYGLKELMVGEKKEAELLCEQGYAFYNGRKVMKDYRKAVELWQRAAELGEARAQNRLAMCYKNGEGVEQDLYKAIPLFQKAAEQGLRDAQYNLACIYKNGEGVGVDLQKAIYWFRRAEEQGDTDARRMLETIGSLTDL